MTEFEKATVAVKRMAIYEFKKKLIEQVIAVYEQEYSTASGEFDEFYHAVINIIKNS